MEYAEALVKLCEGGRHAKPVVCSIGTLDPWNAAGLGLDVKTLDRCDVRPVTVIAGVTAQDARGIYAAEALSPGIITAQHAALQGANVCVYRVGALLSVESVQTVAQILAESAAPSVYDPVIRASGGGSFASSAVVHAMCRELIPLVSLVTPNLDEAEALCGFEGARVRRAAEHLG